MSERNLLLGRGELLTTESPFKPGGGPKKYPYNIQEVREALSVSLGLIEQAIMELPDAAKPRGEGVFELTLHPSFLAKSYFPEGALRRSGLRDLGSKETTIIPRTITDARDKGKQQATATIFVAGNMRAVQKFSSLLFSDSTSKTIQNELREIENLAWLSGESKIAGTFPNDDEVHSFEVALHAGADEEDIVVAFAELAKSMSAKADLARRIRAGRLTFLPLLAKVSAVKLLSNFAFLRVARLMPALRITDPNVVRQTIPGTAPLMPLGMALDQSSRVAIFDGGLGTTDMSAWAKEFVYEDTKETHGQLLLHGNEVTSTFLFGRYANTATNLPQPYMNVDHYRVLSPISGHDPDLFDVLQRIKSALETNEYKFVNLSLGPRMPIYDEEVHAWTATLDQLCSSYGIFTTVAVGNDGDVEGADRIQPPADMVNAIAVGAADSSGEKWKRASYSCIGPGRSPGYVKPDGLAFGGSDTEPFKVFNPIMGSVVGVQGTSYSAPLILRTAAGVAASTEYEMTAIALKALLVHHADKRRSLKQHEVGWGRFKEDPINLLECGPESATIIFQGKLAKGEYRRCPIPFPNVPLPNEVELKATICIQAHTDPEHVINYTRSGMGVIFRPRVGIGDEESSGFFGKSTQYKTAERQLRDDAHKWETCLHRTRRFTVPVDLADPVFDIEYHARERSRGVLATSAPDVRYALIVTITAKGLPEIYNLIRQRYDVLQPVVLRSEINIGVSGT
jgi:hypothetical protein